MTSDKLKPGTYGTLTRSTEEEFQKFRRQLDRLEFTPEELTYCISKLIKEKKMK